MLGADERYLVSVSANDIQPRKARPIRLPPHISGASAFRRIMRACLDHLVENRQAAIAGVDDEGIHQARVAIRRLRSALVMFEDYAGATAALDFRERLRDVARVLGEARDWDVFLAETVPAYLADRPGAAVGPIIQLATKLRATGHRRVRRALMDPAHHHLVSGIDAWVKADRWRSGLGLDTFRSLDGFCRDLAGPLLDRAAKRVRKRGRNIGDLSPEERHELRKAMKKLRYNAEFLATLYPNKGVRRYVKAVEQVQDVLGTLNDAAATGSLLDRIAVGNGRNLAELDAFRNWTDAARVHDLGHLEKAWNRFEAARPFWG